MADQQQCGARGRFFQQFQQGVGGAGVHFVRRIHNHDAAAAIGRRHRKKRFQAAHFVHGDLLAQFFGFFVIRPAQHEQARFGPAAMRRATG